METIEERIKKSSLHASSEFDYKRLSFAHQYLLPITIQEEEEELVIMYDVTDQIPVTAIEKEEAATKAAVLIQIGLLHSLLGTYEFTLSPDNLYYDSNNQIKVKKRDIASGVDQSETFLKEYKAIIGALGQSKYSYEDFLQGGESLLTKQPFLEKVYHGESVEEVNAIVKEEYDRLIKVKRETKVEIKKSSFTGLKIATLILGILCAVTVVYTVYDVFFVRPFDQAIIKADQSFLSKDYVAVIDSLSNIGIKKLNTAQKYELAYSYINGEDIDSDNKNTLLSKFSIKDSEERMEYWICLGRQDTDAAINIAMKQSEDALLVIAYNKKKALIKDDPSLTAEEKNSQTQTVEQQLKTIQDKYQPEKDAGNGTAANTPDNTKPSATPSTAPTSTPDNSLKDSTKDILNN